MKGRKVGRQERWKKEIKQGRKEGVELGKSAEKLKIEGGKGGNEIHVYWHFTPCPSSFNF